MQSIGYAPKRSEGGRVRGRFHILSNSKAPLTPTLTPTLSPQAGRGRKKHLQA